jgi:hypothetical protein
VLKKLSEGGVMVRYDFPKNTNKHSPELKISHDNYIETKIEPFDSEIDANMSSEVEVEMVETIYNMRRDFKRTTKKLRKYYSNKEPKRSTYRKTSISKDNHLSNKRVIA